MAKKKKTVKRTQNNANIRKQSAVHTNRNVNGRYAKNKMPIKTAVKTHAKTTTKTVTNTATKTTAKTAAKTSGKLKSLVQSNIKLALIMMIVIYFLLDYMMMECADEMTRGLIIIFTLLAPSSLYGYYVFDYQREIYPTGGSDVPKYVKNKKKYVTFGWLAITIWGILFMILEPVTVPRFFTMLDSNYYESQILLMLFIAPVMEEIIFRYLLYDRWLRQKWGWLWGCVAATFVFVICHPVTDFNSFVIYWAPTVLFFAIYHEFGLYGSIVIHMIYNMMAI